MARLSCNCCRLSNGRPRLLTRGTRQSSRSLCWREHLPSHEVNAHDIGCLFLAVGTLISTRGMRASRSPLAPSAPSYTRPAGTRPLAKPRKVKNMKPTSPNGEDASVHMTKPETRALDARNGLLLLSVNSSTMPTTAFHAKRTWPMGSRRRIGAGAMVPAGREASIARACTEANGI